MRSLRRVRVSRLPFVARSTACFLLLVVACGGPRTYPGEGDVVDRAAWTALARALFNLDEMITKG